MSATLIITLILSWWVTHHITQKAQNISLLHAPNHRSMHVQKTPHGGGLGIVIGMLPLGFWTILTQPLSQILYLASLALGLVIAIKGLIDDMRPFSAKIRFSIQVMVCILLLWALENLPIPPYSTITDLTPTLLFPLLVLAGVWWINLFNFMDGIDGLAGSQAIFMLLTAAGLIVWHNESLKDTTTIRWMVVLSVAIFGFLLHNWAPARIFMGDVGSTFTAFMILFLALLTIRLGWLSYYTWLILGAYFITDTTYTLLYRLVTGQRWWEAHRSHAYQRLTWQLNSHAKTTLGILALNLIWLTPLAVLSVIYPTYGWGWVLIAYAPLLLLVHRLGAGKPEVTSL
ncbi:MraY family glycosyltransferase [Thiofilum flexile]|uniref:MraY family glycosyltransferase n=1 Tax=Thiofilum flexile TaxID=125627 RepID=UPI0003A8B3C7|nr:glycosyltransferase family 4 protein [Thiofilum flexile]